MVLFKFITLLSSLKIYLRIYDSETVKIYDFDSLMKIGTPGFCELLGSISKAQASLPTILVGAPLVKKNAQSLPNFEHPNSHEKNMFVLLPGHFTKYGFMELEPKGHLSGDFVGPELSKKNTNFSHQVTIKAMSFGHKMTNEGKPGRIP